MPPDIPPAAAALIAACSRRWRRAFPDDCIPHVGVVPEELVVNARELLLPRRVRHNEGRL
jgi:hypothetical protein